MLTSVDDDDDDGGGVQELSLIYGARRNATVTCFTDTELLTVARLDFVDIVTHVEDVAHLPEFSTFLQSVELFRGWPIDLLPHDKPHICTTVYFRSALLYAKFTLPTRTRQDSLVLSVSTV